MNKAVCFYLLGFFLLSWSTDSGAAIEERHFTNPELEKRYYALIAELRCTVCQNQNLADSNADLAKDLRSKTAEMLEQGKSNQEILTFMSDRYGDFILYRPPFRSDTALLWLGPVLLLLCVVIALGRFIRRQQTQQTATSFDATSFDATLFDATSFDATPSEQQRSMARKLLADKENKD